MNNCRMKYNGRRALHALWLTTLCALCGAVQAKPGVPAAPTLHALEEALEVSSRDVLLPSSEFGALVVTPCGGCAPRSLQLTAATRWFLGDQAVAMTVFRSAVARAGQPLVLTVLYDKVGRLTRVLAPAQPAGAGGRR
ncbi:MAG: hypothetical protein WCE48_06315 [Steroidobacteraceae bacterium]